MMYQTCVTHQIHQVSVECLYSCVSRVLRTRLRTLGISPCNRTPSPGKHPNLQESPSLRAQLGCLGGYGVTELSRGARLLKSFPEKKRDPDFNVSFNYASEKHWTGSLEIWVLILDQLLTAVWFSASPFPSLGLKLLIYKTGSQTGIWIALGHRSMMKSLCRAPVHRPPFGDHCTSSISQTYATSRPLTFLKWKYDPRATWAYILKIKWVWVKKNGFRFRPQHLSAI